MAGIEGPCRWDSQDPLFFVGESKSMDAHLNLDPRRNGKGRLT